MKVQAAISVLEGIVGTLNIDTNQSAADWLQMVKYLLRTEAFRDLDDIQVQILNDIDDTGVAITDATHLIACLGEMNSTIATDTAGWFGAADADSDTIELGAAALPDDVIFVNHIRDVATTGVSEYYPMIFLAGAAGTAGGAAYGRTGITLDTGLTFWADGDGGNDIATDGMDCVVVYRN